MDEFLRFFAFRTGVPCGYLLFFLVAAFADLAALVLLLVGILSKPRRPILAAVSSLFLLLSVIWFAGNVMYDSALDINPEVSASTLAGTWKWKASTLILRHDGSYVLSASGSEASLLGAQRSHGKWHFTPVAHIELHDSIGQHIPDLEAVSFRKKLYLVIDFGDPDSWDGDLQFHREPGT